MACACFTKISLRAELYVLFSFVAAPRVGDVPCAPRIFFLRFLESGFCVKNLPSNKFSGYLPLQFEFAVFQRLKRVSI